MSKPRVLFLCVHNSCRSQMAEALLRDQIETRIRDWLATLDARRASVGAGAS